MTQQPFDPEHPHPQTTAGSAPEPALSRLGTSSHEGPVTIDVGALTTDDVVAVARHDAQVVLSDAAREAVAAARRTVEGLANDTIPHYGISTGFGALATEHIPTAMRVQLQKSLVRSHAAGSGPEVEREVIRSLMLLRISTLATGHTGVKPETVDAYIGMLNAGITPVVHEYGSLGCSGDLAPLAHCALALMGEGVVRDANGEVKDAGEALRAAGIEPVELAEKEGLALINGTDGMLGQLVLAIEDLKHLLTVADIAAGMSIEGLNGTDAVFDPAVVDLRKHPGVRTSAANIVKVMKDSPIRANHREDMRQVQDAYSLRCTPQVLGGARDTIAHALSVANNELASAVDNPAVVGDRVMSGGAFHGAPVAYVLDFLAIVACDVASMSERRTDRFLDPARNYGLHAFLADDPGVDSGHMIAQYTQAAIVSTMKRLAVPASVDSIPSSAMQEDHVSMGWSAARKLRQAVDGLTRVLAIEILTAARGIEMRAPLQPAPATKAVIDAVRTVAQGPGPDRYLSPEIEGVVRLVADGSVLRAAEAVTGPLD